MGWGDELMAAGDARRLMAHDPRRVEIIGRDGLRRWHELWKGNPRIAHPSEDGKFQRLINGPGVRPYHTSKSDARWTYNLNYRATPAELFFTDGELEVGQRYGGHVILEPHIKNKASPNKQWGWVHWNKLAWLLMKRRLPVAQMGVTSPLLEGVECLPTATFREACAVLKFSRAAVLPEGGLHHAAAAVGLPAVVIFGGFTPVEVTGYEGHINLGASGADACGNRQPCTHCEQIMASITPEVVADHLESLIVNRNEAVARAVAA